jgi:2',3'-cyclic-nucleotide 2'-phosphodiesterase/3'-nucleotidase
LFKAARRAQITILATTDMHGNVLPIDYYANKPDARGLACAATIIKGVRKENPNLLLLDSGDTIQGTPLVYYHNKKNNAPPDPMMLAMNALHYDAMAVGNHEYNFGLKVLGKARREANFPWLSANTYKRNGSNSLCSLSRQGSKRRARRHSRIDDAGHSELGERGKLRRIRIS